MSKHGKHRKRRPGVHKNANSPETRRFERDLLIPKRPEHYMDEETYRKLAKLRMEL